MKKKSSAPSVKEALQKLLMEGVAASQEEINALLTKQGYALNQSKISRLLHKLGAAKLKNSEGKLVYRLPVESAPPLNLTNSVIDITANETLVVVQTNPGSASIVARLLDHHRQTIKILGTIAGDDTVFIAPKSIKQINSVLQAVKKMLLMG